MLGLFDYLTAIFVKKPTAIFFIILLSANAVGLLLYYVCQVEIHRIQTIISIANAKDFDQSALTLFSSANNNFKPEGKHELIYSGNMYDIVKVIKQGSDTLYYAIADNAEDKLISGVNKFAGDNAGTCRLPDKKMNLEILKFVSHPGSNKFPCNQYRLNPFTKSIINESLFYQSPLLSVLYPPPRHFISA
ncbi:MAG: hypothetical protein ABI861_13115 [Panacibacter sp.]